MLLAKQCHFQKIKEQQDQLDNNGRLKCQEKKNDIHEKIRKSPKQ